MSHKTNIEQLVNRYLTYWKQADIDGLVSMYDSTMKYYDLPSGDMIDYKDIKNYLNETFALKANQELDLQDPIFVEGNCAFIYWLQRFSSSDTSKEVRVNGVELIVFSGEKIVSVHEFYDYRETPFDDVSDSMEDLHSEQMIKLGLEDKQLQQIASEINAYFDDESSYLDPELNLRRISEVLGYTRNQISYVINHVLGHTFYDLVNTRRIEYVVKQMEDGTNMSVMELAINSGFNSISRFYSAFKKHTGMTPAQYKRSHMN
ncbi:MAG: helix-turn-helix domain-containing protein [Gammaproteobacteria bacterium]|jgi:AraC-like DNA-binding protein